MSKDYLSPWAKNIAPSPTLAVDAKAKALKAAGEDVCGFGAGEPDFDTPQFIKDACSQALSDGKTKYAAAPGLPELRQALADQYHQNGLLADANAAQVVVSPGGKYSCYLAILATCGPGDEVIIPAPYWVSYPEMVKLAGATPKIVLAGDDLGFKVSPEQIEQALTSATKMLILNSPSNPTGCLYNRAEMEAIMDLAIRKDILVMSDEIYEYLLYDGSVHHRPASFSEEARDRVITVSGFSKTFSMTGWRLICRARPHPMPPLLLSMGPWPRYKTGSNPCKRFRICLCISTGAVSFYWMVLILLMELSVCVRKVRFTSFRKFHLLVYRRRNFLPVCLKRKKWLWFQAMHLVQMVTFA
jgi:aspartate aminotransferase